MAGQYEKKKNTVRIAVIGGIIVAVILIAGTLWLGQNARRDTEKAVHAVSILYLDELAGRREQVVVANLQHRINDMQTAIDMLTPEDLESAQRLRDYQSRMKRLYNLEKFAFVDSGGLIYTSQGTQTNIGDYSFDHTSLSGPEISILNLNSLEKKVVIAVPLSGIGFDGRDLTVCFMEIDMEEMLQGVSMKSDSTDTTYCNIYTSGGVALSNTVLGGLAAEDNLLEAMKQAVFDGDYSYEQFKSDFEECRRGEVSFTFNGIQETLSYVPVEGTDWLLTYLIRESVIAEKISPISDSIITKSLVQSVLTAAALIGLFALIIVQSRRNARLVLEKETTEAEIRIKQEEMEHRLLLQEKLLEEEKHRAQQDSMITAMASDYRSVYYVDLDGDDAVCYREDPTDKDQHREGVHFAYHDAFTGYAERFVDERYREGFLRFIDPENIREGLGSERILAYRYLVRRGGREYYEMIRVAGVRHPEDRDDKRVHAIGLGLTVVDSEMRESLAQQQALSDALASAEQANKAKTVFLSNMSHEIRTPMNAIIGLDNIALSNPDLSPETRDYLTKIGDSASHLLSLINDILDMSRIESGRMVLKNEEFSFSRLLEYINTMFSGQCNEKGLEYHCHVSGQVDDWYIGDNMKLRQVLINILGNAVKFTPAGGRVDLDVEKTASFDGKSTLQFSITDTGIGMSEEFLPHIFDTFAQEDTTAANRYGSSGLGMPITKSIVEMMNGNIYVESRKGEGSKFTVTVTLMDSSRTGIAAEIHPSEMTVLVIDDDPVAREHARLVLEKAGVAAETAESGAEAVEMVRLRHTRHDPYNLILVDWKMPGMDGVETTRQIRAIIGEESAIIILTAYKWDDVLEEATSAGVDSFISKPLFAANVLEEFGEAIKRRESSGAAKKQERDLTGLKILLAEDVEVNSEIMKMILQMRGIEVDVAENGRIAVDTFAAHPEGYYAAILMDIRMPEMDGLEATRAIRSMKRADAAQIPIIALTANAFDEDVQRSLQAGLNAHLSKPVMPESLFETLESLIK